MKKILLLALLLLSGQYLHAQGKSAVKKSVPAWVSMIDDPHTNYYDAVRAFESFWKTREAPDEEADILNEQQTSREAREQRRHERKLRKMSAAERQEYDYLKYQYKRFINWKHEVFPYVQEDGRILTREERAAIQERQKEEMEKH